MHGTDFKKVTFYGYRNFKGIHHKVLHRKELKILANQKKRWKGEILVATYQAQSPKNIKLKSRNFCKSPGATPDKVLSTFVFSLVHSISEVNLLCAEIDCLYFKSSKTQTNKQTKNPVPNPNSKFMFYKQISLLMQCKSALATSATPLTHIIIFRSQAIQ